MKQILIISLLLAGVSVQSYGQSEISGYWRAGESKTIVAFAEIGKEVYQGTVAWLEKPTDKKGEPHKDGKNPDKSLRSRHILGLPMVERLDYENGSWTGKLYSPKNGKTVNATFTLEGEDKLKVKVSYRGLKRTQVWYRTQLPK